MHFLDAWRELATADLLRLLAPLLLVAIATLLPGARVARIAAILIAIVLPGLRELGTEPLVTAGWCVLWLLVAWQGSGTGEGEPAPIAGRRGVLETGTLGLAVGAALLALLIAAVARQDMSTEDSRRASIGVALVGVGLLHLMLRRHARRATMGFGAMGLGLQILDGAARGAQVQTGLPPGTWPLIATTLAILLVQRVAVTRERWAGTPWVPDAHDLHD
ncbi:MAG TPA: hypothetical protein VLV15_09040 [Dongiaceae bacterium]|nr:hypothetical protein [Dongiaceae bacterium]